jgi:hypothetical protein
MFLFSARKIGDFGFALPVSVSLSRGNVHFIWRGCSEQGHYLYVELLLWSVVFVGAKIYALEQPALFEIINTHCG